MSDILVTSPYRPFTLPNQFKAVFNGYIYCGTVDAVDPSVSQVQVYLVNESGDKVPVAQPLRTNAGGFLVYNGQPAKFVTDSNHSLLVLDSLKALVWYAPDLANIDPQAVWDSITADDGSKEIGFIQSGEGSVHRSSLDKMRERVTPQDKGAVGDGVTNDQAAFDALEASFSGQVVDLMSKTYLVSAIPTGNRYANGYFKVGSSTFKAVFDTAPKFGTGRVVSGEGALALLPDDYDIGPTGCVVAMGPNAMGKMAQVKNSIAIGPNVMSEGTISRDNIGMGPDALKFVQADSPNQGPFPGTRLIGIGGNAFRHVTSGNRGVAIGRNSAQAATTGIRITSVGSGAMSSYCPIDWTGVITNPTPVTASEVTAFGADTLALCDMNENTGIGVFAGGTIKKADGNWFGGSGVGRLLDSDLSNANKVLDLTARTGTYSISGSTVTVNSVGVNAIVGNRVRLKTTTGPIPIGESVDVVVVSAPSVDQFTFTCPISGAGSGNVTIDYVETAATRTPSRWNTLTGARCGELSTHMQECTLSGYSAGKSFQGTSLTLYGWGAGFSMTGGTFSSGFGHAAMRYMQDGSNTISVNNSTCIGANSRISGDNQVQLGDAATTTYVYGTVQNRSDERDKTDVRDTVLGIDFILGLRPVDGKWDMRDDYVCQLPEKPIEPIAPTKPVAPIRQSHEQGARVYHLDGDSTNKYSRVIETGHADSIETDEQYQVRLDAYQAAREEYQRMEAEYREKLEHYQNSLAEWEKECVRISEHNKLISTGKGRDGSKKRNRYHHWFLAQEVKELCDKLGVDFGGYQDHSLQDGGCDVKTLGYDEFIPPTVKAVQQCWSRLDELEKRISKLE